MSGFTEYQASGASDVSGARDTVMTWETAQRMLPLIRRIVGDVQRLRQRAGELQPEKDRLDRSRHQLEWPARNRRYQVTEELSRVEADLLAARTELASLGVALLNEVVGQVGFPTLVNNRRAFFSWHVGEEQVAWWHYSDSLRRRPVPEDWKEHVREQRRNAASSELK